MDGKAELKYVIQLFVLRVIPELLSGEELPRINFCFPDDAFEIFDYVKKNPYKEKNHWTLTIDDVDIVNIKELNVIRSDGYTIIVNESILFFELLTKLVNELQKFRNKFGYEISFKDLILFEISRIWLRMNASDFHNVEEFLQKQINFLKDSTFDKYIDECVVGEYQDFDIKVKSNYNMTYCESDNKLMFNIYDKDNNCHSLPSISYGIDGDTCYIYAVQKEKFGKRDRKIERSLYKLNNGIDETLVHPNFVLAMKCFIDMLANEGISKIKVPLIQVLNYGYHEILSEKQRKTFENCWYPARLEYINSLSGDAKEDQLENYRRALEWTKHVVDKQDFISEAKTEGLLKLFYRIMNQFDNIEILSDPFIESEYLEIRIKEKNKVL